MWGEGLEDAGCEVECGEGCELKLIRRFRDRNRLEVAVDGIGGVHEDEMRELAFVSEADEKERGLTEWCGRLKSGVGEGLKTSSRVREVEGGDSVVCKEEAEWGSR